MQQYHRHKASSLGTPKATCQHQQRPQALAMLTSLRQHQNMTTLSLVSGCEAQPTSWPTCEGEHGHRVGSNTEGLTKVVQAYAPLAASSRRTSQGGVRCYLKMLSSKQSCHMLCFIKNSMARGCLEGACCATLALACCRVVFVVPGVCFEAPCPEE